jgi:steroid delta-isomerase-like uncharacterized protein
MADRATASVVEGEFLERFSEDYLAAWNGHDASAMTPLVTPDVIWRDPALPEPARGEAAVREFMEASWRAFPDLAFEDSGPPSLAADGRSVTIQWRMRGTNSGPIDPPGFAPTGRSIVVDGVDLWIFDGERISDYTAFYDMSGLIRQLGLMPAPGSRAERVGVALQRLGARLRARRR